MRRKDWFVLSVLLVILLVLEVFITYRFLTTVVPGANDFYSRWHGGRALLVEGRNPYALEVTEEIQPIIGIDPSEVGRGGFNYPLHVIFLFWPLVYFSYAWAQAIWWVVLQWLAVGAAIGMLAYLDWKPDRVIRFVLIILMAITFYPIVRSIFLGQFTIPVMFFLVLAILLLKRNHDIWAGVLFSITSIKPQMIVLIGLWLVFWMIGQKRWRFFWGLLGGGVTLLLASMVLMPRWPINFLEDLPRYRRFAGGRLPIKLLFDTIWPASPEIVWQIVAGILILIMLIIWWRNWRSPMNASFINSLNWAIILGLFLTFQTGTTNQVLLLIPLFVWLDIARQRWDLRAISAIITFLWVFTWGVFLLTIEGNYENEIMFLLLTLPSVAILLGQFIHQWRTNSSKALL